MIREFLRPKEYKGQTVNYAHRKVDGHRVRFSRDRLGRLSVLTTTYDDIASELCFLPAYALALRNLPFDSEVEGELWLPCERSSAVKTAIIEQNPSLCFDAFAVPRWNGEDIPDASLDTAQDLIVMTGLPWLSHLRLTVGAPDPDEWLGRLDEADEGWVFKTANYEGWYKLKPVRSVELVATGWVDGNGANLGLVGSIRGSVFNAQGKSIEVARVGGLDEETRLDIDERKDLGRVFEAAYQYVGAKGRLRHPRFLRWRDDRRAVDCTTKQDDELVAAWD